MLDITMFFFLVFHFLPFVLASPCFTRSQTAVFAHRDLLSIPGLSIEAMSPITPAIPRQPSLALATEATIVLVECAAKATAGHGLSIATQDPSPFYHDHQSSWRSEDITDVLLAGIMALAALLALAIKYLFIPLGARGQQPGQGSTDVEASGPPSGSHDDAMPLENIQPQSRSAHASSDDINGASAT